MKKIDIFFHNLSFLTLKYEFFQALTVTRDLQNHYESLAPTFSEVPKRVWVDIFNRLGGVQFTKSAADKKKLVIIKFSNVTNWGLGRRLSMSPFNF